jgi:hypothetical protein
LPSGLAAGQGGLAPCDASFSSGLVQAALWLQSGCRNITPNLPASGTPKSKNPESSVMIRGLLAVRGGGIERPWLLSASTSRRPRLPN